MSKILVLYKKKADQKGYRSANPSPASKPYAYSELGKGSKGINDSHNIGSSIPEI